MLTAVRVLQLTVIAQHLSCHQMHRVYMSLPATATSKLLVMAACMPCCGPLFCSFLSGVHQAHTTLV